MDSRNPTGLERRVVDAGEAETVTHQAAKTLDRVVAEHQIVIRGENGEDGVALGEKTIGTVDKVSDKAIG